MNLTGEPASAPAATAMMMKQRPRRLTKPRVFTLLMGLALILMLLPSAWTRWLGGVLQPLGWLQWSAASAVRTAEGAFRDARQGPLPAEQARELRRELQELRRQIGHQTVLLGDLETRLAVVSGIRAALADVDARIVRAAVVGFDASPRREYLTIAMGRLNGVGIRVGQWVAAGVSRERQDPQATGRALLMRQWLVGRVTEVEPYLSHVQLASDPRFGPQRVRVAKVLPDGQWQAADEDCLLYGLGSGRMEIRHAKADYYKSGYTVVLVPQSSILPATLSVGIITSSRTVADAPLWCDLEIEPWGDPAELAQVYVVAMGP